jgi:choline monooxygenase
VKTDTVGRRDLADALERGYTLPADWYTEAAVFQAEKARIFRRSWQFVGLTERLNQKGDFVTYEAGDVPVLVVRDDEAQLRAFANVCRHRGSQLVLDRAGNRKSIQCHYHAWTYGLNGALRAAPGEKLEPGFDRTEYSLVPVAVDTWGPFVFVNPDADGPPLAEVLGDLPRLVDETGIDLNALRGRRSDMYEIAANWKVVVDNFLECYHCPVAHPGFADLLDLNDYHIREYEHFSTQSAAVKESARKGKQNLYAIGEGVEDGFYAYLWPNFMINVYPGPGNVSLNLILPVSEGRTRARYEYCFVDAVDDVTVEEFVAFIDQVQREDTVLCESVQRGLQSGFFDQGRLLLSRERALRHFQKLVYRSLTA